MIPDEIDEFATRYFREWAVSSSSPRSERVAAERDLDRTSERLDAMLETLVGAEEAWPITLALVDRAPDEAALSFVAAGPLEDLVRRHGAAFADRLVGQVRVGNRLREALRFVWGLHDLPEPLRGHLGELMNPSQ